MRKLGIIGLAGAAGLIAATAIAIPAYSAATSEASQWVCVSEKTASSYYVEVRSVPHACETGFYLAGVGPAGKNGAKGLTGNTGPQGPPGATTAGATGLDVTSVIAMAGEDATTVTATCPASNPYLTGGGGDAGGEILTYSSGTQATDTEPGSWTVDRTPIPGAMPTGYGMAATAFCAK